MEDQEIRMECLKQVVASANGATPADIVAAANQFADFVINGAARGEAVKQKRATPIRWTPERNEEFRRLSLQLSPRQLAEHFGATQHAIQAHRQRLGLTGANRNPGALVKARAALAAKRAAA